jgi:hydroxypyruvate isomerase
MPRFSANLGFLFADLPHTERVAAAGEAGFPAVEMHWPYEVPAAEMKAALGRAGVTMLGLNTPTGNPGEFGLGAVHGREKDFAAAVELSLTYGAAIGATALHCMAGLGSADDRLAENTFVKNLCLAADKAAIAGMTLLIEPINHRDRPAYFLCRVEQAAAIIGRVERANVKIMYDFYHVQVTQGDLLRRFEAHRELVGHVQIAGAPDRAEPDEGEVNFAEICRALDRMGYDGWIGAEYRPRGRTEDGLGWLKAWSA